MPTKKTVKSKTKTASKLTKKDLEYFRSALLKLKDSLLHDIRNMADNPISGEVESRDLSGHVQHMADVATDMYDKEFNLGLASHDREIITKIDAALKRLDQGTYGICLGTGKPISKARLKAIPYTEHCLAYQEELENKR